MQSRATDTIVRGPISAFSGRGADRVIGGLEEEEKDDVFGGVQGPLMGRRGQQRFGVRPEAAFKIKDAEFLGYGTGGAPLSVMAKADLTMERPEDYQRLLSREFGKDVKVFRDDRLDELIFQVGEEQPQLLFTPGNVVQDVAANPAAIAGLATEVASGLGGAAAAGPAGAIVASSTAAFASRFARLATGKALGYNDMGAGEIFVESAIDGGLSALGGVLGEGVAAIYRRVAQTPQIKAFLTGLTDAEIDAAEAALTKHLKSQGASNSEIQLTVQQIFRQSPGVSQRTRDVASAMERGTIGDSEKLAGVRFDQEAALRGQAEAAQSQALSPDVAAQAALDITEDLAGRQARAVGGRQESLEQFKTDTEAFYLSQLDQAFSGPGAAASAGALEQVLKKARSETIRNINGRYSAFYQQLGDVKVDLSNARRVAEGHKEKLDNDILPALAPEERSVVENILYAGRKVSDTPATPPSQIIDPSTGLPARPGVPAQRTVSFEPVDIDSVSRAITALKAELRKNPQDRRAEARFLSETIDALTTARNAAIDATSPGGAAKLAELDNVYSSVLDGMRRSNVSKIVEQIGKGGDAGINELMPLLLGKDGRPAQEFMALVNSGDTRLSGALLPMRDAIRAFYRKNVMSEGIKNRAGAHQRFMSNYGDGLEAILPTKEFNSFKSGSRSALTAMDAEIRRADEISRNIARSFEGRLASTEFGSVVDMIQASKNPVADTQSLLRIMRNEPDMLDVYKGVRARKLIDDASDVTDAGQVFNPNKLDTILRSDNQLSELRLLYGDEYVDGLRQLSKLTRLTQESSASLANMPADVIRAIREEGPASAAMMVWRGLVARPLSRAGLLTTSALKIMGRGGRESLGDLLARPDMFLEAMRLYRGNAPIDKWRPILTTIGLSELLDQRGNGRP